MKKMGSSPVVVDQDNDTQEVLLWINGEIEVEDQEEQNVKGETIVVQSQAVLMEGQNTEGLKRV